mgnify:CR=1 FL=1
MTTKYCLLSNISIHALRVEGDDTSLNGHLTLTISIHALRVEGDPAQCIRTVPDHNFYPRPSCGGRLCPPARKWHSLLYFYPRPSCGGRPTTSPSAAPMKRFLSTPFVWRATDFQLVLDAVSFISIHALRVEGDQGYPDGWTDIGISIHALRVEGDQGIKTATEVISQFLSTPFVWRATSGQPRSMCACPAFLSTPFVWRATYSSVLFYGQGLISIHALRVEGDSVSTVCHSVLFYFYPRPSCGGRRKISRKITIVN